jgi:hypothetical protein
MRCGVLLLLAFLLTGCATKYQDMGLTGGVSVEPVMTDVYRIVARGNAYTSLDRVQDFALMKAAETTLAAGGNYFVILDASNRTRVDVAQMPSTAQTSVIGHTALTTYSPGATYNFVKPGEAVMIRVVRLQPNETPPAGAFPAQDIVNTMGPRLRSQS